MRKSCNKGYDSCAMRVVFSKLQNCPGFGFEVKLLVWLAASQLVTRSTRHSPKSYDELTGGWNTVLWRVDWRLKRRAVTAVTS